MSREDALSSIQTSPPLPHLNSSAVSPISNGSSPVPLSISHIEAVIQMATASAPEGPIPGLDTRTQLFVGNLPYRVRWQDLKDLFRKAGTVLRADVSLGPDNRSRGYGTVLLATREDAARAVEMFNGYNWQTRILEVRQDRLPPSDLDISTLPHPHPLTSSSSTAPFFFGKSLSSYGSLPNLAKTHTLDLDDFQLQSAERNRNPSTVTTRNLFVGNLPFHCQWQDLKDLFRQAGTIIRADVALGPDGRSRGFGTVSFANDIDAERAVSLFNGYDYNGRILKVHYDKFAQSQPLQAQAQSPLQRFSSPIHLQSSQPQFLSSRLDAGTVASASPHIVMPSSAPLSALDRAHSLSTHDSSSPFYRSVTPAPFYHDVHFTSDTMNSDGVGIQDNTLAAPPVPPIPTSSPTRALPLSASPHLVPSFQLSQQAKAFANIESPANTLQGTRSFSHSPRLTPLPPLAEIPPHSMLQAQKLGPPPLPLSTKPSLSSVTTKTSAIRSVNDNTLISNHSSSVSPSVPVVSLGKVASGSPRSPPISATSTSSSTHTYSIPDRTPAELSAGAHSDPFEGTVQPKILSRARQNSSHSHRHPGPITLPSPSLPPFTPAAGMTMSPFQGLPPITPSMPTFTFVPQNATPPLNPHFLSPGVGLTPFSPPVPMSPGSYYHPDPRYHSLPWNPAPGAPIHTHPSHHPIYPMHGHSPLHSPSASAYFAAQSAVVPGATGPADYFSVPPPSTGDGYFPPVPLSVEIDQPSTNNVYPKSGSNPDSTINNRRSSSNESVPFRSDNSLFEGGEKSKNPSPDTSEWDNSPEKLHSIAEELGRISIGVKASNNSLAGDSGTKRVDHTPAPPVAPQRTHSDEAKLPTAAALGITRSEAKSEFSNCGAGVTTSSLPLHSPGERRASWTPEATKIVFRRELMSSIADSPS